MIEVEAIERAIYFLRMYVDGAMTKYELINKLIFVASEYSPEQFIQILPDEIIEELRKNSFEGIADPQDILLVDGSFVVGTDEEIAKYYETKNLNYYLGLNALHFYFYPNVPNPPFEERKCIGIVNEIEIIENKTVIIGDFESWLIRSYPIEIIGSKGKLIVTKPLLQGLIADSDQILKDIKQLDRFGLWLEESIKPSDIEIGSEVWVTRKKTIIES